MYVPSQTLALSRYADWLDKKYTFTVYAVDFLGIQSETATIKVRCCDIADMVIFSVMMLPIIQ